MTEVEIRYKVSYSNSGTTTVCFNSRDEAFDYADKHRSKKPELWSEKRIDGSGWIRTQTITTENT